MNIIKSKKIVLMALIFVMIEVLAGWPLPAKERRGATVVVTMTDGSVVKGELLAVKANVLLVYDRNACQGKSLDLPQVARVKILKKSKFLAGLGLGLALGLLYCVYNLEILGNDEDLARLSYFVLPPMAGLGGGLLGALAGIHEKFSPTGESSRCLQQDLARLKRHAREQDVEKPIAPMVANGISSYPDAPILGAQRKRQFRKRFRLLWSPGMQLSSGITNFHDENRTFRFVDSVSSKDTAVYPFEPLPKSYNSSHLTAGRLRLECEWTPHFSSSLELISSENSNYMQYDLAYYSTDYARRYESPVYMFNAYSYTSLLLGLNWKPFAPSFARKHVIELGVAAGPARAQVNLDNRFSENSNPPYQFKALTWSYQFHAAYDHFYTENFSLGIFMEYQYLRAQFPGATFFNAGKLFWLEADPRVDRFIRPTEFTIPGHNIQLGGKTYGLRVGFRF